MIAVLVVVMCHAGDCRALPFRNVNPPEGYCEQKLWAAELSRHPVILTALGLGFEVERIHCEAAKVDPLPKDACPAGCV